MRQATALGLKLAVYLVIFGVTMPVIGLLPPTQSLILAAVHTLLLWLADLTILPRFGNQVALIVDGMTLILGSFLVLGGMAALPNPIGMLVAVPLALAFEWWFHRWLFANAIVE